MIQPEGPIVSLRLRLFGPFAAQVNGAPLPRLRSRKVQSLLALLTLRAGVPMERGWLAGLLWPDSPESTALATLRGDLVSLRRALGPAAARLRAPTPRSLCLELAAGEADVLAFDAAVRRGDPASLEEAVALYRGPLLAGWTEEWVFEERRPREEACLAARERLAAWALERGEAGAAEQHLRRAVALDPLRESTQRALMQVLSAGGNYAAALHCYRELQLRLHRELNAEPDAETQTLFQRLRSEARRLSAKGSGLRPLPAGASGVDGGPGTGCGLDVSGVNADAAAFDSPPLRSEEAARHNLPLSLTRFIGREQEIARLGGLLGEGAGGRGRGVGLDGSDPIPCAPRLVTLTGAGGCGKTRLALRVAADLLHHYPHGVWFVDLTPLADSMLVPQTIAAVLGVPEEPGRPIAETLTAALRPKQLLLVLDNCEHLLAPGPGPAPARAPAREAGGCAELAERLLQSCPQLRILATSREALGIAGEAEYGVPPLSLPPRVESRGWGVESPIRADPADPSDLTTVTSSEAVQLFLDRAQARTPSFVLTPANVLAVTQICWRLNGMPLAIVLAAARVRSLPVDQIAVLLDDCFRLLVGGSRTAVPRHQTLRALIDWSHDLLSEPERILLRRLWVFAGGWTLEAVEAVCGFAGISRSARGVRGQGSGVRSDPSLIPDPWPLAPDDVLDLLSALVDKSLVVYEEAGGRYRLLETVRQYARERLLESGEAEALRARHLAFFLRLAEEAEPHLTRPEQVAWLDRLEVEHDNFRAALVWGEEAQLEAAVRLAGALWWFWVVRTYHAEGSRWFDRLFSKSTEVAPAVRAKALNGAGYLARLQDRSEQAVALCGEARAIWQQLGDERGVAWALCTVAFCADDVEQFERLCEEGLRLWRKVGDPWGVGYILHQWGARLYFAWYFYFGSYYLGMYCGREGLERAKSSLLEALSLFRELQDPRNIAFALGVLALVVDEQGERGAARRYAEEALSLFRQIKDRRHLFWFLIWFAEREQDPDVRRVYGEEALPLARELGDTPNMALLLGTLGRAEEALQLIREWGHDRSCLPLLSRAGHTAWRRGDYQGARAFYQDSLAICQGLDDRGGVARSLEEFAGLAARQGQRERAVRLLGAAEAILADLGVDPPRASRPEYERAIASARASLGDEAFAAAWAEGTKLTTEQAVSRAIGGTA